MRKKLPYLLPSIIFFLGAPLVYYLCFREVPLSVSPQTTYLTEPLTNDGKSIDWFRAIKERFEPKCEPEENGFRMVAAALGKTPYFTEFDWYWPELCRELDLDPHLAPTLKLESAKEFFKREYLLRLEKDEPAGPDRANAIESAIESTGMTDTERIGLRLQNEPWTAEEFPFLVRWIEENSPLLDLAAEALQKDSFFVPKVRGPEFEGTNEMLYSLYGEAMIPWNLEEGFFYRMNYRLGENDLDGAWKDALCIIRMRIHRKPYGLIEADHFTAPARMVLHDRTLTEERRKRFSDDLDRLPQRASTEECLEFRRISALRNLEVYRRMPEMFLGHNMMAVNWNVLAVEINRNIDLMLQALKEVEREPDPEKRKAIVDALKTRLTTPPKRSFLGNWLGKPITVGERSREFAWADHQAYFRFQFSLILAEQEQSLEELRTSLQKAAQE